MHAARNRQVTITRCAILLAMLVIWEIWTQAAGNRDLIAPPSAIFRALVTTILPDEEIRTAILLALLEVVAAYALAIAAGLAIGLLVGATDLGRRSFYPIVLL